MDLRDKSTENKAVAEKCLSAKWYNAGASRAYYSAFQMAKYYLESNGFDYESFLNTKRNQFANDKPYSHNSLSTALFTCLYDSGNKSYFKALLLRDLHELRIKADYYARKDSFINEIDLKNALKDLDILVSVLCSGENDDKK